MNQIVSELFGRKSVRVFDGREIGEEEKRIILESALQAPTAGNMTLYTVIDVKDGRLKERLAVTCDHQNFIAKAPLALIFLADVQKWYDLFCSCGDEVRRPGPGDLFLALDDALIAAQNAVTAAWSMGIGSCYIGDVMENYEIHRELLKLPDYVFPAALVVFGYPSEQQLHRKKPDRFLPKETVCENFYEFNPGGRLLDSLSRRQGLDGGELQSWVRSFCARKWNSDFSREMNRSAKAAASIWMDREEEG